MIVFNMLRGDLSICCLTVRVNHVQESGIVHFFLASLKTKNYPNVLFLSREVIFLEELMQVFMLQDGIAPSEVLEQH
jgi:hypothetical protein